MESDHQATIQENSEQQGGSPAAKSYECTFCKRGFSNAQALGGHMNIHRKDKAKLKQVSSSASNIIETKQQQQQQRAVLDIPKMPPLFPPILPPNINSNLLEANRPNNIISQDIDQRNSIRASSWPWFLNQEGHDTTTSTTVVRPIDHHHHHQNHDDHVQVHQLPFFSQRPSVPDHQNPGQNEKSVQPSDSDLDLELRLGPQDSSSSTANATRKFF